MIKDKDGVKVDAQVAAREGRLPPDFKNWKIADEDGYTVAHTAARWGSLPPDFSLWDLKDNNGVMVKDALKDKVMKGGE
jgi:hypothetical protein